MVSLVLVELVKLVRAPLVLVSVELVLVLV